MSAAPAAARAVHVLTAVLTVALAMGVAAALRERSAPEPRPAPYESGVLPRGLPRERLGVPFFLIAAFFVIFDMEAAILFAWAVAAREAGVVGLIEAAVFIGVLLVALGYLWLDGALAIDAQRPGRGGRA
ncbi:MAG: NADH-quinone oxidoreductase subunit A [Paracoccaceae bacterium]